VKEKSMPPLRYLPLRRSIAGVLLVLFLMVLLASTSLTTAALAAPPSPPATVPPRLTATPTIFPSPTPIPPQPTPAVGEPFITLRLTDRLYLHTPNPPDVLGIQIQIITAVAATIHLTATLDAPALPSGGSVFPSHHVIQAQHDSDNVYLMPGGFTVPLDTAIGSHACVGIQWSVHGGPAGGRSGCATVVGDLGGVAPTGTVEPPGGSPTPPPTAPCYLAALAALTRQGALYSQGGANPNDPIDPKTRKPYPRSGPNSFDCSGLVWLAYAQAGVSIGQTTLAQLNNGIAINCLLDDLHGVNTRCWTLGDLVFLDYPGGRHVAIYVGQGLFFVGHHSGCEPAHGRGLLGGGRE
jgi:hypothetical protein